MYRQVDASERSVRNYLADIISTWSSPACPQYCADTRPSNMIGLYLAYDKPGGAFCCDVNYNTTTKACGMPTRGSNAPFDLTAGNVIYNRTDGATIKHGTLSFADLGISNSTSSSSVAAESSIATASVSASASATTSSSSTIVPVAVGIAVPLGVLLIAALLACGVLFSQNRRLRKAAREAQASPPAPPKDYGYRQSVTTSPAPVYEYRNDAGQTNWAPIHAQGQQQPMSRPQDAYHGHPVYAKVAPQEPVAQEVSAENTVGELPGDKPMSHR